MQFEFLLVNASLDDRKPQLLQRELNELGAEGWELVASFGHNNQTFVMQRPVDGPVKPKVKGKS